MPVAITGLQSGFDTESMITELMKAQRLKENKFTDKITKNEWKTEAWGDLNKKIYSFYTTHASKLRMQGSYRTKSAKSSNEAKLKVTANAQAAMGTHTVVVKALASSQYVTGAVIKNAGKKADYKTSDKLSDIGIATGTVINLTTGSGASSKQTSIEVTDSMTIKELCNELKNAGITANFDEKQQRFFFSSNESGLDNKFTITTSGGSTLASSKSNVYNAVGYDSLSSAEKTVVDDAIKVLRDKQSALNDVLTAYASAADPSDVDETAFTDDQKAVAKALRDIKNAAANGNRERLVEEKTTALKGNIKSEVFAAITGGQTSYTKYGETIDLNQIADDAKTETLEKYDSDDAFKSLLTSSGLADDRFTKAEFLQIVSDGESDYSSLGDDEKAVFDSYSTALSATALNNAVNAIADSDNGKAGIEADAALAADAEIQTIKDGIDSLVSAYVTSFNTPSSNGLSALGIYDIDGSAIKEDNVSYGGMVVVEAADAEVVLDGATMTQSSNTFTVNGISLDLYEKSDEEIKITVSKDVDGVYKMVKDALTEYNKLVEEMSEKYYAESARKYTMLTDEQKEEMTDDEVKKWEDKIKSALLRRDTSLGSLMSSMRSSLNKSIEYNGQSYNLASFGIVTGNYKEYGKLHIKGDSDDSLFAGDTDKLKKAIEDDPEMVMEVLSGIFGELYSTMSDKCSKTTLSSALTFYNDKQLKEEKDSYEKDLKKLQDRLEEIETRYRKQFTAMEKAMANLNSRSNAMASMLGMNTQQ
ncbi:MAG: flagellar filament capping protein FliD [Lachnospiraceae bacterium]|nr:flagellar filament capping protein FliD [Lachnospiraceae bacterium]